MEKVEQEQKQEQKEQESKKQDILEEIAKETTERKQLDFLFDTVRYAEQQLELENRILRVIIASTKPHDWVDFEGNPYLTQAGCSKLRRRFGIGLRELIQIPVESHQDAKGKYYIIGFKGYFFLPGQENNGIEAIGSCSTRDNFFGKSKGQLKPLEEVQLTNITKKAYTNCYNRGIKALLGITGLTWEDIKPVLPKSINGTQAKVHFGTARSKEGLVPREGTEEKTKREIKAICLYLADGDYAQSDKYYHSIADFYSETKGKTVVAPAIDSLSTKWMFKVHKILLTKLEEMGINPNSIIERKETNDNNKPDPNGKSEYDETLPF